MNREVSESSYRSDQDILKFICTTFLIIEIF